MKQGMVIVVLTAWVALMGVVVPPGRQQSAGVAHTLAYFREQAGRFAESASQLHQRIDQLEGNNPATIQAAKDALKTCRTQYKSIAFFLEYFLVSTSIVYNAPPVHEVEEPFMEYREPTGLQVIEALLFEEDVDARRRELLQQAALVSSSAADLTALLYGLDITDTQVLESIRLELVRVSTLGIAGYDAPELQTGITEAGYSLMAVKTVLQPYLEEGSEAATATAAYLDLALSLVREDSNFISFNRLRFLTTAMLPLQRSFNRLAGSKDSTLDVFNLRAMNMGRDWDTSVPLVKLGKTLFFEKQLSRNNVRSCGSCHQPDKYFTDQLPKSLALDGHSRLLRHTPTLLYAAYQHAQFWDGRAKNLEEQVLTVLHNPLEMDAVDSIVLSQIWNAEKYRKLFRVAFPQATDSLVTMSHIACAITAYMRTLAPMNAPFDRYLQGDKKAMTTAQENGFNLFMGKARCGSCHFVPLFNGVLPPLFDRTELEVLGTTAGADLRYPLPDTDSGRFNTYPIPFYKGAFKTPTLRNIAVTAPYMHHGAFTTLEEVMEFYNRGGGAGLGLPVPTQTLSSKPLGLNESEIKDIILFLGTLTDSQAKTN